MTAGFGFPPSEEFFEVLKTNNLSRVILQVRLTYKKAQSKGTKGRSTDIRTRPAQNNYMNAPIEPYANPNNYYDMDAAQDDFNPSSNSNTPSSSTLSSLRFNLNENSNASILVYKLRSGYTVTTQRQLCRELDKEPNLWRCSKKPISRGTSRLNIQVRDLLNEPDRTLHSGRPNQSSSIANAGLPRGVWWRRLLLGEYKELFILSPESSSSVGTASTGRLGGSGNTSGNASPDEDVGRVDRTWRA